MREPSPEATLPSIRVAVTESCNLRCEYCPTDGDSVAMQSKALETEAFEDVLTAAVDVGFTNFSFTGGEPLLSDVTATRTFALAGMVNSLRTSRGLDGYTKLNTNGANLLRYREDIAWTAFDELKVSLDTLDPDTFKRLAKRNKSVFDTTVEGIVTLKDDVPIRLQTVVGKYNIGEVPDILGFCRDNGLDIKFFDLSRYDNALAGSGAFADANYVPLGPLSDQLEAQYGKPAIKYAVGGYGHAKKVFTTPEGAKIEMRDTSRGAHYSADLCESCPQYMCQDGLCNLVVAADGHIRFCREGGSDQTIATVSSEGGLRSAEQLRADFVRAAGVFAAAQNVERAIVPGRTLLPLTVIRQAMQ